MSEFLTPQLDPLPLNPSERSSDPLEELRRAEADYDELLDWWERRHPVDGPRSRWDISARFVSVTLRLDAARRAVQRAEADASP